MSGTQGVIIDVPEGAWLSSNDRRHWADVKRRRALLRAMGKSAAIKACLEPVQRAAITAYIQYATGGRADPNNAQDTTKPIIDGMVDAGIFVDDSSDYIIGPDHRRDTGRAPKHWHRVRLVITEQVVEW